MEKGCEILILNIWCLDIELNTWSAWDSIAALLPDG